MTRFTGNTSTTDPQTKRNLISASETLLSRLKQLWWKFYDGLLMKKLGEYQQGDPRITTFIQTIENGTPLERTEAREKLSVILHAFEEIARSQTAYHVYKQFGNEQNTLAALKNADEQRRVLAELGVSKQWYASGVDLSKQYPNSPLSACTYNPLQDGATMPAEAELRMAITLGLKNEPYREWAKMNYNEIEQAVKQAAAVREIERQIAEYKRLNDPPTELPDGTPITPKNKENETTYDYFVERIYDPDRWDANLLLEYDTWLNDTYGKTEWRKKVELADRVTYEFASSLIKETIMGGVDTVKFGYKLVVDPQQTTQEILDSAAYVVNNPEVLVEAARTVYKNFEEGTPEERAGMLGSVASVLVPGVSIMKVGKVSQVTGGLQDASKLIDKVQDVNKVFRKPESLADLLPFATVVTPEGVRMIVPKEIPGQVHRVEALDGSRGVGNGGTPKAENNVAIENAKKITHFDNPADPFRDAFGAGSKSHPEEWNKLIKDMKENGVEVVYREGAMGYGPLRKGEPGQILIDPEACMSALRHEYSHYGEAKSNKFPSAAESYQDWEGRIADELKAYTIEIEEAKRLGLDNIAEQLQKNFEAEKQYILDRYGPIIE